MNNLFARLIAQAEVNLAEVARRTIDNVTIPLKVKSQEVVAELIEAATSAAKTIAIKAALGLFAAVMLIVALAYGLAALHRYLVVVTGPIEALLIMGALFAVLAVIAIVVLLAWPKPKPKAKPAIPTPSAAILDARRVAAETSRRAEVEVEIDTRVTVPPQAGPDADLKTGLDAIVSALGEAGFRREQAGLKAGMVIASQMRPMQLVSLALIGGFIAGVRMTGKRSR